MHDIVLKLKVECMEGHIMHDIVLKLKVECMEGHIQGQ